MKTAGGASCSPDEVTEQATRATGLDFAELALDGALVGRRGVAALTTRLRADAGPGLLAVHRLADLLGRAAQILDRRLDALGVVGLAGLTERLELLLHVALHLGAD